MQIRKGIIVGAVVAVVGALLLVPSPSHNSPLSNSLHLNDTTLNYGYCCASCNSVDDNTEELLDVLNAITASSYFRYFKVNSEKPCPYWAVNLLCMDAENTCSVCKCDENSIPLSLRIREDMSDIRTPGGHIKQNNPFPANLDDWGRWSNSDDKSEYVDLVQNPEGNTGYSGPMAVKVWQAIYQENCPSPGECQEMNILRTLLSGLHTSINMHVCTNFYKDPEMKADQRLSGIYNNPNISFSPNCEMFRKRIAPNKAFIENLYILYQFTLRALSKSKDQFVNDLNSFNAGAKREDEKLHKHIKDLFQAKLLCTDTFDETRFLQSPKAPEIIPKMEVIMTNVTHLMDCVTCEKCRIWGKVETKGIVTAMKILLDPSPVSLDRSEKVTLVNLARQLAFSVRNVKRLNNECIE